VSKHKDFIFSTQVDRS